jgi:hypothetical protein
LFIVRVNPGRKVLERTCKRKRKRKRIKKMYFVQLFIARVKSGRKVLERKCLWRSVLSPDKEHILIREHLINENTF